MHLISTNSTVLAEGGGRSGKTFAFLRAICIRASKQKSDHLAARYRFSHAKQALCYQTMPDVLQSLGLQKHVTLNKTDWFYEFPNGSTIWIGGLDEKTRTDKILGNEYATVFLNEASQISFESRETLVTRINPPDGMRGIELVDYNPPSIQHWGYQVFHKREFPDGRPVPEDDFALIKINPIDNPHLSPEYVERLKHLSPAKRKRFLEGEYALDAGSLWRRAWFRYGAPPPGLHRVVIGVDPAGSAHGDEIGIVAVGMKDDEYYVLDDVSCHGTPNEWAAVVASIYNKWEADAVIAEKNYGGDMVEHTIKSAQKSLNVRLVNASRGKVVRAEPISALYEQGKVTHRTAFADMEDEMCIYEPGGDFSPNRLDAAVWALSELSDGGASMLDVV